MGRTVPPAAGRGRTEAAGSTAAARVSNSRLRSSDSRRCGSSGRRSITSSTPSSSAGTSSSGESSPNGPIACAEPRCGGRTLSFPFRCTGAGACGAGSIRPRCSHGPWGAPPERRWRGPCSGPVPHDRSRPCSAPSACARCGGPSGHAPALSAGSSRLPGSHGLTCVFSSSTTSRRRGPHWRPLRELCARQASVTSRRG